MEFGSEENCKAVKESMEDCEIDGSKVTMAYARARSEQGAKGCPAGRPAGEPAGQKAAGDGKGLFECQKFPYFRIVMFKKKSNFYLLFLSGREQGQAAE